MDKGQIGKFIKQIMGAYPSFEPTDERMEIWGRHMTNIDYDLAVKRLDKHIVTAGTGKFPPSISEILNPEQHKKKSWKEPETVGPAAIINGGYKTIYDESDLN